MHTVDSIIFTNLLFLYEFCEYHSVCKYKVARYNASAAYENRTPDVTLAKLDDLNVRRITSLQKTGEMLGIYNISS